MQLVRKYMKVVPKSDAEAAVSLQLIGERQQQLNEIKGRLNDAVAALHASAMAEAQPIEASLTALVDGLESYVAAHRIRLTDSGKRKTVTFPTGTCGWRTGKKALKLTRAAIAILGDLKDRGLTRFIHVEESLNAQRLIEEGIPDGITGLSIGQAERFFVKPTELAVSTVEDAS